MAVNNDKPKKWLADITASVDLYNDWFMKFAPAAFRAERQKTTQSVKEMFTATGSLKNLSPEVLRANPGILPSLRMATCPPIARDRLIGLAGVSKNLVGCMEAGKLPSRMRDDDLTPQLKLICDKIAALLDKDMLPWLGGGVADAPTLDRGATIIADRLCGAQADPIIRNAQEQRQLEMISGWLTKKGYRQTPSHDAELHPKTMPAGTFAFRMIVRVGQNLDLNIPVDAVAQPKKPRKDGLPILIEAKSAGDYTNPNKRRKEESDKMGRLRQRFGKGVPYILFLCGVLRQWVLGLRSR